MVNNINYIRKKKMNRFRHKEIFKKLSFVELVNLIGLSVILIVIPLIVRVNGRMPTDEELLIKLDREIWESFSYYKSFCLIIVGAVILFTAFSAIAVGETKLDLKKLRNPVFVAAGVYAVFVILSSVFSDYKQTALNGIAERHESVFVLLVYIVILLTAKRFVKDEEFARIFLYIFIASAFLIGIIGVFQTFGLDIFKTDFGKRLVLGEFYGTYKIDVGYNKAYATLYNPNCVGLYAAFLTPVFFFAGLFIDKRKPLRYVCFFICLLMIICLYGSGSVAGYIGFFAAVVVSIAVLGIYTAKFGERKLLFFGSLAAVLFAALILVFANFNFVRDFIVYNFNIDGSKYGHFIRDIEVEANQAVITTLQGSITLSATDDGFALVDSDSKAITPNSVTDESTYVQYLYNFDKIGQVVIRYVDTTCTVRVGGIGFLFGKWEDDRLTALSLQSTAIDVNQEIPSIGFNGLEHMATGRGFIWSRSIPVMLNNVFIGGGPDSFAYLFPQHDIVGKIQGLGDPYTIVDKPHNAYMQVGINTGMISLLALLFIFGYYIVTSLKTILSKKADNKFLFGLTLGLLTGVCAYLVCSLSTDSTVSVSPIFYAGLGFAMAVTEICKGLNTKGK